MSIGVELLFQILFHLLTNSMTKASLLSSLSFDFPLKKSSDNNNSPGQFGSVDRALACELKGPKFKFGQGHVL